MTTKSALIIRHVPYEGVAGFREPIEAAGYEVDRIDVADPNFSGVDLREPDLLIMMGGPMGVYEHEVHPWISCQLRRLAQRIEARRPTLGVCFGAQMIAAAMGGEVFPGPHPEIGFHPVAVHHPEGLLRHIAEVPVLHWHGDTFTLPQGAELLASSDRYAHQGFRYGPNVLALQFHAEMGLDPRFDAWIAQGQQTLADAGIAASALRYAHEVHGARAVAGGRALIAEWLAGLA